LLSSNKFASASSILINITPYEGVATILFIVDFYELKTYPVAVMSISKQKLCWMTGEENQQPTARQTVP
jgi:hypothetical protein